MSLHGSSLDDVRLEFVEARSETPRNRVSPERIVMLLQALATLATLIIASLALYAALDEADAVRKQQIALVWPRVVIDRSYSTTREGTKVSFHVTNKGIGPALVDGLRLELDDVPVQNWWAASRALAGLKPEDMPLYGSHRTIDGQVLAPGEDKGLFELSSAKLENLPDEEEEVRAKMKALYPSLIETLIEAFDSGRLRLELCYCSVFDDCWVVQSGKRSPEAVSACPDYPASPL